MTRNHVDPDKSSSTAGDGSPGKKINADADSSSGQPITAASDIACAQTSSAGRDTLLGLRRLPYLCLAWVCIALGAAGVFLPLLPTTPFLLVAAWAAPKGPPRLDAWLRNHPRLGPYLRDWEEERAVPLRAKRLACALLLVSWVILLLISTSSWLPIAMGALFVTVGVYVCTRPLPQAERGAIESEGEKRDV
jgi:uncharacterized protein